jgi:hypothetical protein
LLRVLKFKLALKRSRCDIFTIKNIIAGCTSKVQNRGLLKMLPIMVGSLDPLQENYCKGIHLLQRKECSPEIMFSHHIVILP